MVLFLLMDENEQILHRVGHTTHQAEQLVSQVRQQRLVEDRFQQMRMHLQLAHIHKHGVVVLGCRHELGVNERQVVDSNVIVDMDGMEQVVQQPLSTESVIMRTLDVRLEHSSMIQAVFEVTINGIVTV
jgi:cell division FtsZ-interacting protein ZapD